MDANYFAAFTRSIDITAPRRTPLGALLGGGIAALLSRLERDAGAKNKHKKRRKRKTKKQRIRLNDFGCVNVGSICHNGDQCCSGICDGTIHRKTCRAHDASTCQGQDACIGEPAPCITTHGDVGQCAVTTGNASYCKGSAAYCFDCATDADCVPHCGAGAACVACADCAESELQTACASTSISFYACDFR